MTDPNSLRVGDRLRDPTALGDLVTVPLGPDADRMGTVTVGRTGGFASPRSRRRTAMDGPGHRDELRQHALQLLAMGSIEVDLE